MLHQGLNFKIIKSSATNRQHPNVGDKGYLKSAILLYNLNCILADAYFYSYKNDSNGSFRWERKKFLIDVGLPKKLQKNLSKSFDPIILVTHGCVLSPVNFPFIHKHRHILTAIFNNAFIGQQALHRLQLIIDNKIKNGSMKNDSLFDLVQTIAKNPNIFDDPRSGPEYRNIPTQKLIKLPIVKIERLRKITPILSKEDKKRLRLTCWLNSIHIPARVYQNAINPRCFTTLFKSLLSNILLDGPDDQFNDQSEVNKYFVSLYRKIFLQYQGEIVRITLKLGGNNSIINLADYKLSKSDEVMTALLYCMRQCHALAEKEAIIHEEALLKNIATNPILNGQARSMFKVIALDNSQTIRQSLCTHLERYPEIKQIYAILMRAMLNSDNYTFQLRLLRKYRILSWRNDDARLIGNYQKAMLIKLQNGQASLDRLTRELLRNKRR